MTDIVPELNHLLGGPVVFIGWPLGIKGNSSRKWKHLRDGDMTPDYLAKLQYGNIGVSLGEPSGGLCVVDWDQERFIDPFIDLNPHLKDTLQTHGARGRSFWLRFEGDYPRRSSKLKISSSREERLESSVLMEINQLFGVFTQPHRSTTNLSSRSP